MTLITGVKTDPKSSILGTGVVLTLCQLAGGAHRVFISTKEAVYQNNSV
ncbi:hypothetical protein BTN49_2887 [Candidatus Enterovibrio escicola]|uniref:Uncharacterized protein n=1 Tax=Candidatus Enterovibrio escicola TaxID=1927127 RepID=A0A2A5SZQ8_9GAMM|nr:hypothetical protein [Candidatus Enterovibrio escacola]PCS21348.1 hypothetical protein BTN49_2887 [Candidatus Enterovibrio escacola]